MAPRWTTGQACTALVLPLLFMMLLFQFPDKGPLKTNRSSSDNVNHGASCPYCVCPHKTRAEDILNVDEQIKKKVEDLSKPETQPDNAELVGLIRDHFIDLPRPYLTKFSLQLFQTEQAKAVDKILKEKRNGFFIECGALDGERSSNTNWLEQKRGWNGLLIEMDPSYYLQIRGKNRKCFSINACLSPETHPTIIKYKEHRMGQGHLLDNQKTGTDIFAVHETYCFPFLSMMLALNITHVDYFSLDVEGLELTILKTIPFDKIDISVFTVEYVHGPDKGAGYVSFMETKGYKLHSKINVVKPEIYYGANDFVFVKEGIAL